jgi:hypothetical protein
MISCSGSSVSIVSQKGSKTNDFLEQKAEPAGLLEAGQSGHVERVRRDLPATICSLHNRVCTGAISHASLGLIESENPFGGLTIFQDHFTRFNVLHVRS